MKLLKKLTKNIAVALHSIKDNLAELYTMLVLFVALPGALASLTSIEWGLLVSFTLQAVVGVLYIRGRK